MKNFILKTFLLFLLFFGKSQISNAQSTDFTMSYDSTGTEQNIPIYERIEFYFPDAISIDGNGINDAFGLNPGQYPFVKTYRLSIFNRWGEKVFDSDVKEETFSSARAPQGVYIYKVFIKDIYDVTHTLEGTLTVLK